MLTKFGLSLTAAIALSVAVGGSARANPIPTNSDEARAVPHSPTNDEIDAAETGNPNSTDYSNRDISSHSPTNAEIDAGETESPESLAYRNQPPLPRGDWKADWEAVESGNPHEARPVDGTVPESHAAATPSAR
jgi:hypothetical protein